MSRTAIPASAQYLVIAGRYPDFHMAAIQSTRGRLGRESTVKEGRMGVIWCFNKPVTWPGYASSVA